MLLVLLSVHALAVPPPQAGEQVLVVTTQGWRSPRGTAVLVEDGRRVLGPVPVFVGHGGLGWGIGEHPRRRPRGPEKREGDGRSPAGIFRLGTLWRSAWARSTFCVDDPKSVAYARIVSLSEKEKPRWASAEHMAGYRVAIVVEHNPYHRAGRGSCIFVHDGAEATVGCTAASREVVDALVVRLRWGARLVQLPLPVYRRVAGSWKLPAPSLLVADAP